MTTFVSSREIYERVIRDAVPRAARQLWIATADIKDMYVDAGGTWCRFWRCWTECGNAGSKFGSSMKRSRGRTGARTSTAIPDCGMAGAANTAETAVVGSIAATRWCDTKLTTAARI